MKVYVRQDRTNGNCSLPRKGLALFRPDLVSQLRATLRVTPVLFLDRNARENARGTLPCVRGHFPSRVLFRATRDGLR